MHCCIAGRIYFKCLNALILEFLYKIFAELCPPHSHNVKFLPANPTKYKCINRIIQMHHATEKYLYWKIFERHGLHFNAFGHCIQVKHIEWGCACMYIDILVVCVCVAHEN